jgi:predicted transcriptional regulator
MYSPRIPDHFIPTLHHLARLRGQPMTAVVAEAIAEYLEHQDLMPIADLISASERRYGLCRLPGSTPLAAPHA